MHIQLDATKSFSLAELWMLAPEIVIEELMAATAEAGMLLVGEVAELTPQGVHGALRGSIQSSDPEVLSGTVLGMVGSPLSYTEAVELGTKPHPVSAAGIQSIADWAQHSNWGRSQGLDAEQALGAAHAIAWKIRKQGTPPVGMFSRALEQNLAQVGGMYRDAAERIVDRMAGAS